MAKRTRTSFHEESAGLHSVSSPSLHQGTALSRMGQQTAGRGSSPISSSSPTWLTSAVCSGQRPLSSGPYASERRSGSLSQHRIKAFPSVVPLNLMWSPGSPWPDPEEERALAPSYLLHLCAVFVKWFHPFLPGWKSKSPQKSARTAAVGTHVTEAHGFSCSAPV